MKNDLKSLVLGALLHDIGKFAQRANRPLSKNLEGEYLPVFNGKPSHWHALYTDYFIENDLPLPDELNDSRSRIARIASVHHRPGDDLSEMCVMIADRLSSGADRLENIDVESQTGFRESRLVSVFDEVELTTHEFKQPGSFYHNLLPLDSKNEQIFPVKGEPKGDSSDYKSLFDLFLSDILKLQTGYGFRFYLEKLISFP